MIFATAFVRATATGLVGVELGLYLTVRGLTAAQLGYVVSAGLGGATVAAVVATLLADARGRRRTLIEISLLGAVSTVGVIAGSSPLVLALAAFLAMLNGMGRDRGAALIVEQAILPATVTDDRRTSVFARYNVVQDVGHACGALLAGLPEVLERTGLARVDSHRGAMALYAALLVLAAVFHRMLSTGIERRGPQRSRSVSPASRRILVRIASLFALDGLGGGFLTTALLAYFFFERFGVSEIDVAGLFFVARILNAVSHLAAAWLARRIGLVNTMVFTHMPSSLLLVTVALAPSFPVAAALFILREGLVEMDVPTRQSYVLAVVGPGERTLASGVTHLVRMGTWALAPAIGGVCMQHVGLMTPLIIGAVVKISYDVLLWVSFRAVRPPEER